MAFRDQDIPAMLAQFGVPVSLGGVASVGILDDSDELVPDVEGHVQIVGGVLALTVQSSVYPSAKIGDLVTVQGAQYRIRERLRQGDGALTKWLLGSV